MNLEDNPSQEVHSLKLALTRSRHRTTALQQQNSLIKHQIDSLNDSLRTKGDENNKLRRENTRLKAQLQQISNAYQRDITDLKAQIEQHGMSSTASPLHEDTVAPDAALITRSVTLQLEQKHQEQIEQQKTKLNMLKDLLDRKTHQFSIREEKLTLTVQSLKKEIDRLEKKSEQAHLQSSKSASSLLNSPSSKQQLLRKQVTEYRLKYQSIVEALTEEQERYRQAAEDNSRDRLAHQKEIEEYVTKMQNGNSSLKQIIQFQEKQIQQFQNSQSVNKETQSSLLAELQIQLNALRAQLTNKQQQISQLSVTNQSLKTKLDNSCSPALVAKLNDEIYELRDLLKTEQSSMLHLVRNQMTRSAKAIRLSKQDIESPEIGYDNSMQRVNRKDTKTNQKERQGQDTTTHKNTQDQSQLDKAVSFYQLPQSAQRDQLTPFKELTGKYIKLKQKHNGLLKQYTKMENKFNITNSKMLELLKEKAVLISRLKRRPSPIESKQEPVRQNRPEMQYNSQTAAQQRETPQYKSPQAHALANVLQKAVETNIFIEETPINHLNLHNENRNYNQRQSPHQCSNQAESSRYNQSPIERGVVAFQSENVSRTTPNFFPSTARGASPKNSASFYYEKSQRLLQGPRKLENNSSCLNHSQDGNIQ